MESTWEVCKAIHSRTQPRNGEQERATKKEKAVLIFFSNISKYFSHPPGEMVGGRRRRPL